MINKRPQGEGKKLDSPNSYRRTHDESTAAVVLCELLQVAEDGVRCAYLSLSSGARCLAAAVCLVA